MAGHSKSTVSQGLVGPQNTDAANDPITLLKVAAKNSICATLSKASKDIDDVLVKLQEDYKENEKLMTSVRIVAAQYRPISTKSMESVLELKAFAEKAEQFYLGELEEIILAGDVEGARSLLTLASQHFDKTHETFKEVRKEYSRIAQVINTVTADADSTEKRAERNSDQALRVGVAGVAVEGAGVLGVLAAVGTGVCIGTGPVGWGVLSIGAGVTSIGAALGIFGATTHVEEKVIKENAARVAYMMREINALVHKHEDELVYISHGLSKIAQDKKTLLYIVETWKGRERQKTKLGAHIAITKSDFSTLIQQCNTYINTEEKAVTKIQRRLGLEC